MTNIYYARIGNRKTPENVCKKIFAAGRTMAKLGFILRSGGAAGTDEAFERGVADAAIKLNVLVREIAEIYLPWEGFRKNQSPLHGSCKRSRMLAKEFHPN